jgi:hypothetical protein
MFYEKESTNVKLGGFDCTQQKTCRGYTDVKAACTTRAGGRHEMSNGNVVTAPFFHGSLFSVQGIQEGESYIFGQDQGFKVAGTCRFHTSADKIITEIRRNKEGMWTIDIIVDGKKITFVIDSEANLMTLSKEHSDIVQKYPTTSEKISGYDDTEPVGTVQIIENLPATMKDNKGTSHAMIIERAAFSETINQNLIPLRQLISSDQDWGVLDKDGGWVIKASSTTIKMDKGSEVADIELVEDSYVMPVTFDATRLKEFLKLPLPQRREEE